ncbi:MAG: 2-hydroxychromene-2-carboxylate isomerase [Aquisalimonadaceae bacterium]
MNRESRQSPTNPREIEFWFEFGSTYSYLSVMRIETMAAERDVTIAWKPFLLGPIFRSLGWDGSPFATQKAKGDYMWRDMARQCRRYGLPWKRPGTFPRSALLPMRVALIGTAQPWMGQYCRQIMLLNFADDRDINHPKTVADVLARLALPAAEIISEAQADSNKLRLREQTAAAEAKGIFGAPTFFVGNEMFWGNDRLEEALAFAAAG